MTCADALSLNDCSEALPAIIAQFERPEFETIYAFRHCLLAAIARTYDPAALEFLVKTLPTLEGQLAHEVYDFLDGVTSAHFGHDRDEYEEWLREVWQPIKTDIGGEDHEETSSSDRYKSRPRYYGIDIYAQRLVFVIDHSNSMNRGVAGVSRLERAKKELGKAILALPYETEFAIVTFTQHVRTWHPELVPATHANKDAALAFVAKMRGHGSTNTYGAVTQSLVLDDNTEAVFLLSDGAPTTGVITNPAAIVESVTRLNQFRRVAINSVGIAIDGPTEQFMRALATENGGEYRAAD